MSVDGLDRGLLGVSKIKKTNTLLRRAGNHELQLLGWQPSGNRIESSGKIEGWM
jgi:hypothetical protein